MISKMNVFLEFSLYFLLHNANTVFLGLRVNWRGALIQEETFSKYRFCMDMFLCDVDVVIMGRNGACALMFALPSRKINVLVKC